MPFDPNAPAQEVSGFDPTKPATEVPSTTPTGLSSLTPPSNSNDLLTPRGKQIASNIYTPILKYGGMGTASAIAAPAAAATAAGTGGLAIPAAAAEEIGAAGAGYAVGGDLAAKLDRLIDLAPPSKQPWADEAQRVKEGAEMEVGGKVFTAGIGTALGPVTKGAEWTAEKAGQLAAKAQAMGINLSPGELLGTKGHQAIEDILNHLPWTSSIIQKFNLGQLQQLNSIRQNLIENAGSSDEIEQLGIDMKNMADKFMQKVGTVNQDVMTSLKTRLLNKVGFKGNYNDLDISAKQAVQQYQADLSEKVGDAYDAAGKQAPTTTIIPQNTINAAKEIMAEQERVVPSARNNALYGAARTIAMAQEDVPEQAVNKYLDPQVSVEDKQALLTQYPELENTQLAKGYQDLSANIKAFNLKKYAQITDTHGAYQMSDIGRQWDKLIDGMKSDVQSLADQSGNEEFKASLDIANGLYKKRLALFDDPAFKKINDLYPGAVASTILQSGSADLIQRYRALVGDNLFNKAKGRLTNDLLGLGENDTVVGDDIRKGLQNLGEGINSVYSPTELNYFKKIAKAVDTREGATNELLSNPLLKKMLGPSAEVAPSGIAKSLVVPNAPENARAIENMLGVQARQKVANAFLPQLLSRNQSGDFLPETFAKEFHSYGRKTLEAWLGKETTDQLANLADVGSRMRGVQRLSGGSGGQSYLIGYWEGKRVASELGSLGAAIVAGRESVAHPVMTIGGTGAMVLGTRQLARMYTEPMGRNLFIKGLMTPATSDAAAKISGQLLGLLGMKAMNYKEDNQ